MGRLSSVDAWWDWSLTTLLDGLYPEGSPAAGAPDAQVGVALLLAVGEPSKCHCGTA